MNPTPERLMMKLRYGLRYYAEHNEVRLLQIAGGGRIMLESAGKEWWTSPPKGADWQVYIADAGQTYDTREMAEQVARNLVRPKRRD